MPKEPNAVRLAIIGDLHDHWTDFDVAHLNESDFDAVIFVGDLGRGEETSRRISRSIARLERPTLIMPGNADVAHAARLNAEFSLRRGLDRLFADDSEPMIRDRDQGLEGVQLCGYGLHRPRWKALDFTFVSGRPFSMGGPELTYAPELRDRYGIESLEHSAQRLIELVDRVETEALVFLAHNGPHGLGDHPTDPWGCDFRPDPADWGDTDLARAIDHARRRGHRVLAVVAGHMHLKVRDHQEERIWRKRDREVLYLNPARVPRIRSRPEGQQHHYVVLTLREDAAEAEEIFVEC